MRIYYSINHIENYITNDQIGYTTHPPLPYIEIDETAENKPILKILIEEFGLHRNRWTVVDNQLFHNGAMVTVTIDNDKSKLRTDFSETIAILEQIESTTTPTNAQIIAAMKFLAKTIKLLLRFIARML